MGEATGPIEAQTDREPIGLGGWLLLPLIGLFLTPIGGFFIVVEAVPYAKEMEGLTPTQSFFVVAGLGITILFVVVAPLHLLVLMLRRHRTFPRWWVAVTWATVVFAALKVLVGYFVFSSLLLSNDVPVIFRTSPGLFAASLVGAFAWTAYMLDSVRVRNTFTK